MKKKLLWKCVIVGFVLLVIAAAIFYIPTSGEPLSVTKRIYANSVIRRLEKEIDFIGEDIVTLDKNGNLFSFEIRSQESAEILYHCIRNAAYLFNCTHACLFPQELPLFVNNVCSGDFSVVYYRFPKTGKLVRFNFSAEDSEDLKEYVITVVEDNMRNNNVIYVD